MPEHTSLKQFNLLLSNSPYFTTIRASTSTGPYCCLMPVEEFYLFMPANSPLMPFAAHRPQGMVKNLNPLST